MPTDVRESKAVEETGLSEEELLQRKRAEERVRESEEGFRHIFESVNDCMVYLDRSGRILEVNEKAIEVFGGSKGELIGKHFTKVGVVSPKDIPMLVSSFTSVLAGRKPTVYICINNKKGQEIHLECSTTLVIRDDQLAGVILIARDITERKRAEEALRESEERYRRLIELSPAGIMIVDAEGTIRLANPAMLRMLSAESRENVVGKKISDIIAPEQLDHCYACFRGVIADQAQHARQETLFVRLDGQRFPVEVDAGYFAWSGKPAGQIIVRDITERKQAEEEIRRRSKELATLYDVSLDVAAQLEIEQLLQTLVEQATRLLNAKAGGIYLYDPVKRETELQVSYGLSKDYGGTRLALGEGVSGKVAETGEPLMVDDYQRWEGRSPLWKGEAIGGVLGVPLKRGDDLLGVLTIDHALGKTFHEEDIRLATLFASQAAIAIENARLFGEEKRRATHLALISEVGQKAVSILDLDRLMQEVTHSIREKFNYYHVAFFLLGEERREVAMQAVASDFEPIRVTREYRQSIDEGIIGFVTRTGKSWLANDVSKDPYYIKGHLKGVSIKSELCVPIQLGEEVIGALDIQSIHLNAFDETDVTAMETLSGQIASAIENARLYEERKRKVEELAVLNEIGRAVSSVMQLDDLLESISQEASRVIDTSNLYIALYDAKKNEVGFPLYFEEGQRRKPEKRPARRGMTEYVINSGKPLMINHDLVSRLEELNVELIGRPSKSWLGVPMLSENEVIGVLAIQDYQNENAYGESHLRLLSTIANQAAIAIENARLFEAVARGKKEWEETFDSVTDGVYLIDSNWTLMRVNRTLAENFGTTPEELIGRKCYEVIHGFDEPWSECPLREVLETKQAVTREVEDAHAGRILQLSVYPQLDDEGNAVGSVHVVRDITQRRRREEEIERRNRELAALNAIVLAVTGTLDLQEVLQTIQKRTRELLGEKYGPVFALFNEEDQTLDITLTHAQEDVVRRVDRLLGMRLEELSLPLSSLKPVLREALPAGKPYVANDVRDFFARGTSRRLFKGAQMAMGVKWVVASPLRVKGKLIGTMLLFSQKEKILEEDTELLSAIANQAAIAIENTQAYERLKTQNLETISALAAAVEAKDPYTGGHSEKVTQFAIAIAEKMGLSNDEIEDLQVGALLHDIGKIGIPDSVLNKPARLTSAEFIMVKAHSVIAAEIVGKVEALAHLVPIIRHHHERYDGQGYPDGLKGKKIPLGARILAVADGFDAMTSDRPYRRALTEEEALAELERGAGSQWDPQVVEVFVKIYEKGALEHQASDQ